MKKISIIVPVFNEERFIKKTLSALVKVKIDGLKKEIIVVDDGSIDGTYKEIKNFKRKREKYGVTIKVVRLSINRGKGAAIRAGLKRVTGQAVVIQDADLEYSPREIRKLVRPIRLGYADVVYGSRFMGGQPHRVLFFWHMVANRFLTLVSNAFTNLNLTDMETGYKVFRTKVIKRVKINENRFGFEPEVTAKIAKMNCRLYEIGISYKGRKYEQGKKIGWKDGFWALWCVIKYNLF